MENYHSDDVLLSQKVMLGSTHISQDIKRLCLCNACCVCTRLVPERGWESGEGRADKNQVIVRVEFLDFATPEHDQTTTGFSQESVPRRWGGLHV